MNEFLGSEEIASIRIWQDYTNESNIEYAKKIEKKISLLIELMNSVYEDKIQLEEWLTWTEALVVKLSFHSSSFLQLFSGTIIQHERVSVKVFDEPSILALFRVILENYLTFHYLFCDKISVEEKKFRVMIWKYSGLKQRNSFRATNEVNQSKKANEFLEIEALKESICKSIFFKEYPKKVQENILKGIKPRLENSWKSLNEKSEFQSDLFKDFYGFKSNYSHSEFISILQIKSENYAYDANAKEHYCLFLLNSLISRCILDLTEVFPSIHKHFNSKEELFRMEIQLLSKMSAMVSK